MSFWCWARTMLYGLDDQCHSPSLLASTELAEIEVGSAELHGAVDEFLDRSRLRHGRRVNAGFERNAFVSADADAGEALRNGYLEQMPTFVECNLRSVLVDE